MPGVIGKQIGSFGKSKIVNSRRSFLKKLGFGVLVGAPLLTLNFSSNIFDIILEEPAKSKPKPILKRINSKTNGESTFVRGTINSGDGLITAYDRELNDSSLNPRDISREGEIIENLLKTRFGAKFKVHPGDEFEIIRSNLELDLHNIVYFSFKNRFGIISGINCNGIFYNPINGMPFIDRFIPLSGPYYISCSYREEKNRRIPHRGIDIVGLQKGSALGRESWSLREGKRKSIDNFIGTEVIFPYKKARVHRVRSKFNRIPKLGNYIIFEHEEKIKGRRHFSMAYHLSPFYFNDNQDLIHGSKLKEGDIVREGDIVGFFGNTGFDMGPHLHWQECLTYKKNLEPKDLMPKFCSHKPRSLVECFNPLDMLPKVKDITPSLFKAHYHSPEEVLRSLAQIEEGISLNYS